MSRLIDADEILINGIKNKTIEIRYKDQPNDLKKIFTLLFKDVRAFIDEQPTIDAVPVVHGHWYVYETGNGDTEAKCSICGFETLVNEPGNGLHMVGDLKYCTHCGSKMDEVTES